MSFGARLTRMVTERPDETAFVLVAQPGDQDHVSWRRLDETSNRVTRMLDDHKGKLRRAALSPSGG